MREQTVLVFAPGGRDGPVVIEVLDRAGIACESVTDLAALRRCLEDDVDCVLVTEESLAGDGLTAVLDWFAAQPSWSDLPVIALATKRTGRRPKAAAQLLDRLGAVSLIERPIGAETLVNAVRIALRTRRRQYETRSLLDETRCIASDLARLNEDLDRRIVERTREVGAALDTLAFALDAADMGSWDLDLMTDTSRRSHRHDAIFGYHEALATWGREVFLTHVVDDDQMLARQAFDHAAEHGELAVECRIRRTDGALRWIAVKGRVEYEDGVGVRMAGVVMDTTDRRHTEDALAQSQKMEAIGQLTGGVAHDFNNLLTVIVGGLDLVLRRPDDPARVTRLCEAAMMAAKRGEQLTQQLLAFSRRRMRRPETIDVNAVLRSFLPLAERAVGAAIELVLDLAPDIDAIEVDPVQLEAAVLNLVVNARDAMAADGTIVIETRMVEHQVAGSGQTNPPEQMLRVAVRDTGAGMSDDVRARVFEPFFSTKGVGKGSGLGLAQVYGFMQSAGGEASIESEPGSGTAVNLFFPALPGVALLSAEVSTAAQNPLHDASSGETVLLTEDDEQVLGMAHESLSELGYRVIVARDAQEAIGHLTGSEPIDLLFSDVVMPGQMNGVDLAIEAERLRPGIKVLLTSGYVGADGVEVVVRTGLPVLDKPYRRDELAATIRTILDDARQPGMLSERAVGLAS